MIKKIRLADHDNQVVLINNRARSARVRCINAQGKAATGFIKWHNQKIRVETTNHHAGIWYEVA